MDVKNKEEIREEQQTMAPTPHERSLLNSSTSSLPGRKGEKLKELCMHTACNDATMGVLQGHGGPFGAMVSCSGRTVSVAHNTVLEDHDPTCHAEMNAIRYACERLGTNDLSACELFTTCEPCPMCLGGIMWSGIKTLYMGVERYTAAMYGFDDKAFYDEVEAYAKQTSELKMISVVGGILSDEIQKELFQKKAADIADGNNGDINGDINKSSPGMYSSTASNGSSSLTVNDKSYMRLAIEAAKMGPHTGLLDTTKDASSSTIHVKDTDDDKSREPFGACIVDTRKREVIATSGSCRGTSKDSTATAVVNAIRKATKSLESHNLEKCVLYCTSQPGLMSFTACLWARIEKICFGVPLEVIASYGYEAATSHVHQACEFSKCNGTVTVVPNSAQEMDATADHGDHKMGVVPNVLELKCEEVFQMWKNANGTLY